MPEESQHTVNMQSTCSFGGTVPEMSVAQAPIGCREKEAHVWSVGACCEHTVHVPNSARCSCKVHAWYGFGCGLLRTKRWRCRCRCRCKGKIVVVVTKKWPCAPNNAQPATHPPLSPPLMYRVPSTTHHTHTNPHTIHTQNTHTTMYQLYTRTLKHTHTPRSIAV